MRRDRLRTTESPDGRMVATWQLKNGVASILRIQNRADTSLAYRWPSKEQVPTAARGLVLFDETKPPDLAAVREEIPRHVDLWDAVRRDLWAALLRWTAPSSTASGAGRFPGSTGAVDI